MDQEIVLEKQEDELYDVRISVSRELSDHYQKILDMRDKVLEDPESENKDITAILNATTSIIKELAKIQSDVYNSERFAVLQQVILNALKEASPQIQKRIVAKLEVRLEEIS